MRLPASFFDDPANSVGALTTKLSTDSTLVKVSANLHSTLLLTPTSPPHLASTSPPPHLHLTLSLPPQSPPLLKGATGEFLGSLGDAAGSVICGLVIAFSNSWRLALVLMGVYPLLILGGIFEFTSYAGEWKMSCDFRSPADC